MNSKTIYLLHRWEIDRSGPYPIAKDADCPLWALSHLTRLANTDDIRLPLFSPLFNALGLVNLLPKWQGVN